MQLKRHAQRGTAMVETVLAIGVSATVLAGAVVMMSWTQDEQRARQVAEHMQAFQNAAAEHVQANRATILQAMTAGVAGNAAELNSICLRNASVDGSGNVIGTPVHSVAKRTCAFDATYLKARRELPPSFANNLPTGERIFAIVRVGYEGADQTGDLEMLVIGEAVGAVTRNQNYPMISTAANLLGGSGGVIPDAHRGNCVAHRGNAINEVCGTQGGWKVDLGDFINSTQLTTFRNALPH